MKLTKFGILASKTTLFTSIRDSNISEECAKNFGNSGGEGEQILGPILEKSKGEGGYTANPFRGGGMDIFWNHTFQSIYQSWFKWLLLNTEITAIFELHKDWTFHWNFVVAVDLKAISFTINTLDFFSNNKSPVKSVPKRQTVSHETSLTVCLVAL